MQIQTTSDPATQQEPPDPAAIVRRRRVAAVVFLMVISILLTSTLLVIGGDLVYRNTEARFWKRTNGVLLDAHIDKHPHAKDTTPDVPVVKYQYSVGQTSYTSDKWSPAGYGLNIERAVQQLKQESPLIVYYNPSAPADSAVVLVPVSTGYFPLVLGAGMFLILVVAMGGGALFAALHPDLAAVANSPVKRWVIKSLRAGLALTVTSLTGLATLMQHSPGGWWQWAVSGAALIFALAMPL